jgi:hypothetical protein
MEGREKNPKKISVTSVYSMVKIKILYGLFETQQRSI